MNYRSKARGLVQRYLHYARLDHTHRCTRIVIRKNLTLDGRPVWGYCKPTGPFTFVLGLTAGMDDRKLAEVVGHEIIHVITHPMMTGTKKQQIQWEEFLCDLGGRLLADVV